MVDIKQSPLLKSITKLSFQLEKWKEDNSPIRIPDFIHAFFARNEFMDLQKYTPGNSELFFYSLLRSCDQEFQKAFHLSSNFTLSSLFRADLLQYQICTDFHHEEEYTFSQHLFILNPNTKTIQESINLLYASSEAECQIHNSPVIIFPTFIDCPSVLVFKINIETSCPKFFSNEGKYQNFNCPIITMKLGKEKDKEVLYELQSISISAAHHSNAIVRKIQSRHCNWYFVDDERSCSFNFSAFNYSKGTFFQKNMNSVILFFSKVKELENLN